MYKTPQYVCRPPYFGVQVLPLKMHYRGKNEENRGRSDRILTHNNLDLTLRVPKLIENCGHRRGHRQTDRQAYYAISMEQIIISHFTVNFCIKSFTHNVN